MAILATVDGAEQPAAPVTGLVPVDVIWQQITSLNTLEALMFISFGSICLFYGWRIFKILVVISFALFGLVAGILLSEMIGGGRSPLLGALAAVFLAVVSVPLMKWAVSILGAAAGGLLTAGLWYACRLPEQYIWAGGLVGVVAGGMISFIVFRIAVMLFSSLGGSALLISGLLAMLYIYQPTTERIKDLVFNEKWFLPAALMIPTLLGIYLQNKFIKGSQSWSV
jgi:hypothetical protein